MTIRKRLIELERVKAYQSGARERDLKALRNRCMMILNINCEGHEKKRIMTVKIIIHLEKIFGNEQILSTDTIFINQPNILVHNHCYELSLQSPFKYGNAFLRF